MPSARLPVPAALAAALVLAPALAGQAPPEAIPRDLVLALLGPAPAGLHVGSAPPAARSLPLLPGRVVGGVERPWESTVVVEVQGDPEGALDLYEAALEDAGWRRPPLPDGDTHGFVTSTAPPSFRGWCGEGSFAVPSSFSAEGRTYLRIEVRSGERSRCGSEDRPPRGFAMGPSLLPPLAPPARAEVRGGSGGRSLEFEQSDVLLVGGMTAEEIAAAYAARLETAGWAPVDASAEAGLATRRFALVDGEGAAWTGLLIVWELAERRQRALLRVDRVDPVP